MTTPSVRRVKLDEARCRLNAAIAGLDDADFAAPVSPGNWTIHEVIVHIAAWDAIGRRTVDELVAGLAPTRFITDVDGFNYEAVDDEARATRSPAEALARLAANRELFLSSLDRAPHEFWHRARRATSGDPVSIAGLLDTWTKHDHEHAAEVEEFVARKSSATTLLSE